MMTEEAILSMGDMLEEKGMTDDEIDSYLEHYGTLGMKWGVRKAARQQNRALNKASRKKDKEKYQSDVQKARDKVQSGQSYNSVRKAKDKYKSEKVALGSREARKNLNKVKNKHYQTVETSRQAKNGKEVALGVLAIAGVYAVSSLIGAAAASR